MKPKKPFVQATGQEEIARRRNSITFQSGFVVVLATDLGLLGLEVACTTFPPMRHQGAGQGLVLVVGRDSLLVTGFVADWLRIGPMGARMAGHGADRCVAGCCFLVAVGWSIG